jgi:hypothetical protein
VEVVGAGSRSAVTDGFGDWDAGRDEWRAGSALAH